MAAFGHAPVTPPATISTSGLTRFEAPYMRAAPQLPGEGYYDQLTIVAQLGLVPS